jgi:hypothetical protein
MVSDVAPASSNALRFDPAELAAWLEARRENG